MKHILIFFVALFAATGLNGCYMYHERAKALVPGIDIDQTLQVAEVELNENRLSTVLTVWAIKDQELTALQAAKVNDLYLAHIDRIDSDEQKARGFSVWHLTWAISNMYRLGGPDVKSALEASYNDASRRVDKADRRLTTKFFYDEKMTMGDAHFLGRRYAKSHLVVPNNEKYLQSFDEYMRRKKSK